MTTSTRSVTPSAAQLWGGQGAEASGHLLTAESVVCALTLLSFGLRIVLPSEIPLSLLLTLATLPVWLGALRRYRYGVALAVLTVCAIVFGLGLTLIALASRLVVRSSFVGELSLVTVTFAGVGVVLWARDRLGERATGVIFGLGMMIGAAIHGYSDTLNAWKGGWGIPVAIVALSIVRRSRTLSVVVLLALAAVSVVFDTRSYLAIFLVCAMLLLSQSLPRRQGPRRISWFWSTVLVLVFAAAIYALTSFLLLNGYLGEEAQQRSILQIDSTGSLLLGGRPEAAATGALMFWHFWGYGFGVFPSRDDLLIAKQGLYNINYPPNNGYVERYMFGNGFELHSVLGDLWVRTGPLGLVLVVFVGVLLFRHLATSLAERTASGIVLFLTFWTFWNLLFSPLLTSYLPLMLAVAFSLPLRQDVGRGGGGRTDQALSPADSQQLPTAGHRTRDGSQEGARGLE